MSTIELTEEQINKLVRQKLNEKQKKWYHGLPEEKRLELARKKVRCEVCDIEIYYSYLSTHKKCKKHLDNLKKRENGEEINIKKGKNDWYHCKTVEEKKEYNQRRYHCIVCDKDVLVSNKNNHEKSKKHIKNSLEKTE